MDPRTFNHPVFSPWKLLLNAQMSWLPSKPSRKWNSHSEVFEIELEPLQKEWPTCFFCKILLPPKKPAEKQVNIFSENPQRYDPFLSKAIFWTSSKDFEVYSPENDRMFPENWWDWKMYSLLKSSHFRGHVSFWGCSFTHPKRFIHHH